MGQTNKGRRICKRRRGPKLPPTEGMAVADLARQAGVTPRTVRYYVTCGALPRPEFRGRRTRYGDEHLLRLRAIAALQKEGLELAEIARRLAAMSRTEVEAYLAPPAAPSLAASALAAHASGRWDRVPLLPGMELHVRDDASPAVRRLAQEFIGQCIGAAALEPPKRD